MVLSLFKVSKKITINTYLLYVELYKERVDEWFTVATAARENISKTLRKLNDNIGHPK